MVYTAITPVNPFVNTQFNQQLTVWLKALVDRGIDALR
jgi:hypothetical protein